MYALIDGVSCHEGDRVSRDGETGTIVQVMGDSALKAEYVRVRWDDSEGFESTVDPDELTVAAAGQPEPREDAPDAREENTMSNEHESCCRYHRTGGPQSIRCGVTRYTGHGSRPDPIEVQAPEFTHEELVSMWCVMPCKPVPSGDLRSAVDKLDAYVKAAWLAKQ